MKQCWHQEPTERPNFETIVNIIEHLIFNT